MREKLMTLQLAQLRELAKAGGVKGVSGLKKEALVDLLIAEDEKRKASPESVPEVKAQQPSAKTVAAVEELLAPKKKESTAKKEATTQKEGGPKKINSRKEVPEDAPSMEEYPTRKAKNIIVYREEKPSENADVEVVPARVSERKVSDNYTQQKNAENAPSPEKKPQQENLPNTYVPQESDTPVTGILEVMQEGYGFIRSDNYLPGDHDVYVSPMQIRSLKLKTGDILSGIKKAKGEKEKFSPLAFLELVNGKPVKEIVKRVPFENLTPIFPNERIKLETPGCSVAMRAMDLLSPVGKGQRGMIVSPPKAGKTTLLKEIAHSMLRNDPLTHMLILLIDERPEEVTDIKEAIIGRNVEVIYSTFDEQPEHHMRVAEMVIERAKRLVEQKEDVVILLDSITRLTRAYNQVIPPSGRTLSGGLDPAALHMPKRFFGAARNMREGGSLTILATALVETGSKMDDVVYEEFKGTGNMEIVLDRKLSEKRIFPAIDLAKSGTRREDLLLNADELEAIGSMRKALNGLKPDEAADRILDMFSKTRNNSDFVQIVNKNKFF